MCVGLTKIDCGQGSQEDTRLTETPSLLGIIIDASRREPIWALWHSSIDCRNHALYHSSNSPANDAV